MTAVVGILNKQAVAIAADSAVTISGANGRKIFNKANKVFTLSKYHPVGIMIYNSATLMGTPWETIIKVYRKQLNDRFFPTVKDYQEDFIKFLKAKQYYTSQKVQDDNFYSFSLMLIKEIINDVANSNRILLDSPTEENKLEFLQLVERKADEYILSFSNKDTYCSEFVDYSYQDFSNYTAIIFSNILESQFLANELIISENLFNKLKQVVYLFLKTKEEYTNYTGLIFTGFGEDEIYPQLIPINISFVFNDKLRYYIDENRISSISNDNDGAVCPFAQQDVIRTILSGVDPDLDKTYLGNFDKLFRKYNQEILNILGDTNSQLTDIIKGLDVNKIVNEYRNLNDLVKQEKYISPLMNAVSSLSKEDLSEMAESLIYLTYLKRRITFTEESVGGPVDVAVISKGDGFVWIKRKHYFRPELNQHFFDNYFNK
jgi:uncharacterized protein (DUF2344 family)